MSQCEGTSVEAHAVLVLAAEDIDELALACVAR